jgi:hypothetical protein
MRLVFRALLFSGCALTFTGCGSQPSASNVANGVTESVATNENDVTSRVIGQGNIFSLKEAVAKKPVAFWFWAPG